MKKFDLHIHTKATIWESQFDFDMEILEDYVINAGLDCIAVTNHNTFDLEQYLEIKSAILPCVALPGIEINLESGHLLLIADEDSEDDFNLKCNTVSKEITSIGQSMKYERFADIFGDLNNYLIIPHYDKDPSIDPTTLEKMKDVICAGEVSSVKKYIYASKQPVLITPVLFSDTRIQAGLNPLPTKQIFIDLNDISVDSIKLALSDKTKVTLTESDGNKLFPINNDGLKLSTGLTVILGGRSSGKTFTMDMINNSFANAQYIRQFELLERDEKTAEKDFSNAKKKEHSVLVAEYLKEFKDVVNEIVDIDLDAGENDVDDYLIGLKKYASERDKEDAYSKAKLFNMDSFKATKSNEADDIIKAVINLIEVKSDTYKDIINRAIDESVLKELITRLITNYRKESEENNKRKWVNKVAKNISDGLQSRSAITPIPEIDLGEIYMNKHRVKQFNKLANVIRQEQTIEIDDYSGFKTVATISEYTATKELKDESGRQLTFSHAFAKYKNPYKYLLALMDIAELPSDDYYKYFAKVEYRILNQFGLDVSGGERSEFNLLRKIMGALKQDILLIDEPESSFDNIFLRDNVNSQIKRNSEILPVVVVTHNNTVGASIKADYILYTKREIVNGEAEFSIYAGYPSDKNLINPQGKSVSNFTIMMDSLEAGDVAYQERKNSYDTLKD